MHTEDLEAFFAVVSHGSVTRAARELDLPKSTISRRLARLEEELGATLLVRTPRATQVTEMGQFLFDRGAPALAHLEEIRRLVVDRGAAPRGLLRVSAAPDLAAAHLGPLCASFLRANPMVKLSLVATNEVSRLVDQGFDVAIRVHMDALESVSTLRVRKLTSFHMALYAAPAYLEGLPALRRLDQLGDCARLSLDAISTRWRLVHERSGKEEEVLVDPTLACNDHFMIRDAALGAAGVAMLPSFLAEPLVREGKLARVLPRWTGPRARVSILWLANLHTSPRVRAFVDAAAAFFDPAPWER